MSDKSLKDKAIDFKGKDYVMVKDRVNYFNETYPNGQIINEANYIPELNSWVVEARVYPDAKVIRSFSGWSQEVIGEGYINKTSALENAETSAVGRALAFMGIGVIESIASIDEINKATNRAKPAEPKKIKPKEKKGYLTGDQQLEITALCKNMNGDEKRALLAKAGKVKSLADVKSHYYEALKEEISK